ncbi:MAG: hypothetical protein EXR79_13370, partial [Myxococcales bacterium]|nr:hypothetical protein [Myxococcales bacterium]
MNRSPPPLAWTAGHRRGSRLAPALVVVGLVAAGAAQGQVGIARGREAAVLALIRPYVDEGPVGRAVLAGVAIQPDGIVFRLADGHGAGAELVLRPAPPDRDRRRPTSFLVEKPAQASADLTAARELLLAAVAANDDGTFFVPRPTAGASVLPGTATASEGGAPAAALATRGLGAWPARARAALTALAWVLLVLALVRRALRRAESVAVPTGRLSRWVLVPFVAIVAWQARAEAPFTPLHANDHAYEDLGVALDLPESQADAARAAIEYGAAWTAIQQATAPWFGGHHDGVGRWATLVGTLACVLAFLAAARVVGPWPALTGTLVMAWAPIAVRVGQSESPLVVAQFVVAAVLWLCTGTARADRLGVGVGVFLLATGHPLGPVFATGAALCAWAVGPRRVRVPRAAQSTPAAGSEVLVAVRRDDGSGVLEAEPAPAPISAVLVDPNGLRADLVWLAVLAAVTGAGISVTALGAGGVLAERVSRLGALPIPSSPLQFWLWNDSAWAPGAALVLAELGVVGLWLRTRTLLGTATAWLRAAGLALGLALLAVAGLLVVACTTDAVRYQAPFAPALVVAATLSFAATRGPHWRGSLLRWPVRIVQFVALVATLVQVVGDASGTRATDAQGEAYRALRGALGHLEGDVWIAVPDRDAAPPPGGVQVTLEAPVGLWSPGGPRVRALRAGDVHTACQTGYPLPKPAYVWLPPACSALEAGGRPRACGQLDALIDRKAPLAAAGTVAVAPTRGVEGLPGEFLTYQVGLARAG